MKNKREACIFELLEERVLLSAAPPVIPVFLDNFSSSNMNAANWHVPTWVSPTDGTYLGRTQLACIQNYKGPRASGGAVYMPLDSYNPTGFSFYGTEIISNRTFSAGSVGADIKFVARLVSPVRGGGVGGIFLYAMNPDGSGNHDEIDFELLSNWSIDGTNRVNTNVYADEPLGVGTPAAYVLPNNGKVTGYHTYEIKWESGSVSWLIDGTLLRTETSKVPAGPMQIYINNWAPDETWPDAYNSSIQPANDQKQNVRLSMAVDSVAVYVPLTVTGASVNLASSAVIQKSRIIAAGTISGTGSGTVQYYWMVQNPDGSLQEVGRIFTAKMVDGTAAIPKFSSLPTANAGDYEAWVTVLNPAGVFNSSPAGYSSVPLSPITIASATVNIAGSPVIKGIHLAATGEISGAGTGIIRYYWMEQGPTGSPHRVSGVLSLPFINGAAAISNFASLPTTVVGNCQAWVDVMQAGSLFTGSSVGYTVVPVPPGIRITSVPALGNAGYARGTVTGNLSDWAGVAVYIYVYGQWWTKPYFALPLSSIGSNGAWSANIDTGGSDANASSIRAYLIPKGIDVPLCAGDSYLPDALSSLLFAEVNR